MRPFEHDAIRGDSTRSGRHGYFAGRSDRTPDFHGEFKTQPVCRANQPRNRAIVRDLWRPTDLLPEIRQQVKRAMSRNVS